MQNTIVRQLTIKEVADLLQKKPQSIEKLARAKKIPAFKIGSSWRFDPPDLAEWIKAQKEAK
jgi:excisionase family DNA binding protein